MRLKKIVRFLAFGLVLILIMGSLNGCSNTKKKKATGGADSQVNLVYYVWGSEAELKVIKEIVADFEAKNSNIKISLERAGDDYFGMLSNRFAAGNEPDIFFMDPGEFSAFARKKLLLNMSDYSTHLRRRHICL